MAVSITGRGRVFLAACPIVSCFVFGGERGKKKGGRPSIDDGQSVFFSSVPYALAIAVAVYSVVYLYIELGPQRKTRGAGMRSEGFVSGLLPGGVWGESWGSIKEVKGVLIYDDGLKSLSLLVVGPGFRVIRSSGDDLD